MGGDDCARAGRTCRHPGQVGPLNAVLAELQCFSVPDDNVRDRLDADHQSRVQHDPEHLAIPLWVSPTSQPTRHTVLTEGQLAGGGRRESHLVLQRCEYAVAVAGLTGFRCEQILGTRTGSALGACGRAFRPCEHKVAMFSNSRRSRPT